MSKCNAVSVLSEFYKPDWEELHDFHAERRDRLTKQAKAMVYSSDNVEERRKLWKQIVADNQICMRCFSTHQHKTVEAFINWNIEDRMISKGFKRLVGEKVFQSCKDAQETLERVYLQLIDEHAEKMRIELEEERKERERKTARTRAYTLSRVRFARKSDEDIPPVKQPRFALIRYHLDEIYCYLSDSLRTFLRITS